MGKVLENIMNFINENTTLLIIICVFLIFVLIGYLIDNSIKTRKLAKMEALKGNSKEDSVQEVPIQNTIKEEPTPVVETKVEETPVPEVAPVIEEPIKVEEPVLPTVEAVEDEQEDINITPDVNISDELEPKASVDENTVEVPIVPVELPSVTEISTPEEPKANEFVIDPKINELLSRDFTKDNVTNTEPIKPIEKEVPVTETKPKYSNSKSLAEILKNSSKKETTSSKEQDLMSTVDFQHELDRLLADLNKSDDDIDNSKDSTLDETTDFSNMF